MQEENDVAYAALDGVGGVPLPGFAAAGTARFAGDNPGWKAALPPS